MASITTRVSGTTGVDGVTVKGSPLTNSEIDANFINLNNTTGSTYITTLGTIATGTWSATTIAVNKGGTGQTSYTDGQLLIGNTTGNTLTKATLTAGPGISITNGSGSITISAGTMSPDADIQFDSLGIGTAPSGTTGEIRATDQITSFYSDLRLKENVEIISNALDKVMQLSGVTYNANSLAESYGFNTKLKQVGVISQEVEQVLPEAVKPAPFDIVRIDEDTEVSRTGENYKTVQYERLIPLLIEAIKEINKEIKKLKENNNG